MADGFEHAECTARITELERQLARAKQLYVDAVTLRQRMMVRDAKRELAHSQFPELRRLAEFKLDRRRRKLEAADLAAALGFDACVTGQADATGSRG